MNFESRIAAVKEGLEELNSLLENMSVFVEKEQATGSFTEFYDFFPLERYLEDLAFFMSLPEQVCVNRSELLRVVEQRKPEWLRRFDAVYQRSEMFSAEYSEDDR